MNIKAFDVTQTETIVTHEELARRLPARTPSWITSGILSFSGMVELNRAHARLGKGWPARANLFEEALDEFGIRLELQPTELEQVPETGAVIVIANHPFGGVDGLSLGAAMLRRRADVRIMTNAVLSRVTKLAPWFLDVDVFDRANHAASNAKQLRAALRHLASGGLLIVFPAGEVSHFQPDLGQVADIDWNAGVGLLARTSGAAVVPCFFDGENSPIFQAAGMLHPALRTALLPRELLARRHSPITLRIGRPITAASIRRHPDDRALTTWLRLRTYALAPAKGSLVPKRYLPPLAGAVDVQTLDRELMGLPKHKILIEQGGYRVLWVRQSDIPYAMSEIGRLRELTFRAAGEGSGGARDLDVFDSSYQHLVLYDADKRLIVGAYRLAFCDERLVEDGLEGLYTHSLFKYRSGMRKELARAIELGRSFVRPEYQRKPLALALLWRGIGEVLCLHPEYRRLVGAVSISRDYCSTSRRMLVAFLDEVHKDQDLCKMVVPRNPIRTKLNRVERQAFSSCCQNVRDLSRLMAELNATTGQGIPILLERYLELGARVLALNLDPAFGDCIDALVVVDLDRAPEKLLKRFMGNEGYRAYSDVRHVRDNDAAAPGFFGSLGSRWWG